MNPSIPAETVHQTEGQLKGTLIGSPWRRLLAYGIDSLLLYTFGHAIAYALFDMFASLGMWSRLLGFCAALIYFSTLECRVGGGRTLGKRLLRLKVVDAQGGLIGWKKAAVRYAIFAAPFFLIKPRYVSDLPTWLLAFFVVLIELGVGGSTLYLIAFNRRTRQGLHDLAVNSYVVNSAASGPPNPGPIWRMHWSIVSAFLALIIFAELSRGISIASQSGPASLSQSLVDERLIENIDHVQGAEVRAWLPIPFSQSALGKFLPSERPFTIIVNWNGDPEQGKSLADQVAVTVLEHDSKAQQQKLIEVEVGRRYDLGIASGERYQIFVHTPKEWLAGASPRARPASQ